MRVIGLILAGGLIVYLGALVLAALGLAFGTMAMAY